MLECEVEYYGEKHSDFYECTLGVDLDLTDEQIERFNKEQTNKAHIKRQQNYRRARFANGPYLYLFKVYPEEDPTENAGPFESKEEAKQFLSLAWAMSGDNTKPVVPEILEKER